MVGCFGGCAAGALALAGLGRAKIKKGGLIRTAPKGPLVGLRVIDISVVIAAPWASALLSEMGAEVIKIECLTTPDAARGLGHAPALGMAGCSTATNRGKQSIVLDLKQQEGMDVFLKLVKDCDVVIQNFRPGAAQRMGIGFEEMLKINPNLIYVSSSGYGQTGPRCMDRIYDPVMQSMVGMAAVQGRQPDRSRGNAKLVASSLMDKTTAQLISEAVLAALLARDSGAGGQHITANMMDVSFHWMWPDCCQNHVYLNNHDVAKAPSVIDRLPPSPKPESLQEVLNDPRNKPHIGSVESLLFGKALKMHFPIEFTRMPVAPRAAAPMIGEHTAKLLKELGYSKTEQEGMLATGAAVSTRTLLIKKGQEKKAKIFKVVEALQGGVPTFTSAYRGPPQASASKAKPGTGALEGITVLDLTCMVAGPQATCILGDQGAEVIKVEHAAFPDESRSFGQDPDGQWLGSMYVALNRNKKSVALNLSSPEGEALLLKLAEKADVVMVDRDPNNAITEKHLPYKKVCKTNKNCVYILLDKSMPELVCQAIGGISCLQTDLEMKPDFIQAMIAEKALGHYAAIAATTALYARNRGRGGQQVVLDMHKCSLHWSFDNFWSDTWTIKPGKPGATEIFARYDQLFQVFQTTDGVSYYGGALTDKEWEQALAAFKKRGLTLTPEQEAKWKTVGGRLGDWDDFRKVLGSQMESRTWAEFRELAKEAEMWHCQCMSLPEAFADGQAAENGTFEVYDGPGGKRRLVKPPAVFSKTPSKIRSQAPLLGQHTQEVLKEVLGFSPKDIAAASNQDAVLLTTKV